MKSLWIDSVNNDREFDKLDTNLESDICIIGNGMFGMTCGYYLSNLGFKVVIVDKDNLAGTTCYTTGKITSQHGLFYNYLKKSYSEKFAKDYLQANEKAILNIKNIIEKESIDCDFEFQNNYLYTTKDEEVNLLLEEQKVLKMLDYNSIFTTNVSLPFEIKGALEFKNQAKFNPLKYILGLAKCIINKKGKIYNNTTITKIQKNSDNYILYDNNNNIIKSKKVIIATRYPFINFPGLYFSKLYQSTSYTLVIESKKELLNNMYINISRPIFSFRTAKFQGKDVLLIVGEDCKTGHNLLNTNPYDIMGDFVSKYYPTSNILYKWSSQDSISLDKLPYIGKYSKFLPNVYVGAGFKKWGMTLSNVAANIIVDEICQKENKYSYLFSSSRFDFFKNFSETKNLFTDSAKGLIFDKFKLKDINLDRIEKNSGGIVKINGKKVGVYRDDQNNIYAINPICSHMGCILSWNNFDKTWDCPCHGSRYNYDGKNIYEPGFKDLERYEGLF